MLAAIASESLSTGVAEQKARVSNRIDEVRRELDFQSDWINWNLDQGGTVEPAKFFPCLFKTVCRHTQVCTTNCLGSPRDCGEKTIACKEELLTCQ